ncbi:NUDIX hydrolase [Thalassobaculum salexigens]|uniref:NUDIX hydrolase n=1 Tax=Thalassobaculum salexigens TaxID=455360 RepID=UPI00248EE133|nr:NUDIX domain-containing protein [Thalassobaculum salexigens]
MTDIIHRNAVRAILLTPEAAVLLMRIRLPGRPVFWIAPGGGIEGDEPPDTALRRELQEEVGLSAFEPGPLLWRRRHTFSVGAKRYCQTEAYCAVHTPRFEPAMSDAVEATVLDAFQWWSLDGLHRLTDPVAPRTLATIVDRYLRHGPPQGPLSLDVETD